MVSIVSLTWADVNIPDSFSHAGQAVRSTVFQTVSRWNHGLKNRATGFTVARYQLGTVRKLVGRALLPVVFRNATGKSARPTNSLRS